MSERTALLCRGCLLACWGLIYGLAVAMLMLGVMIVPQVLIVLVVVAVYFRGRRFAVDGWTFGTAKFASFWEMLRAGMLEGDGVLLGKVQGPKLPEAGRILVSRRCSSWLACHLFLRACRRRGIQAWVRTKGGVHGVIVSPPGGGKSQSICIPFLLVCSDSCVVVDPKGELYRATAAHRRAIGQRVIGLDPFGIAGGSDTFNPLQGINPESPIALDLCRALAEAFVVKTGEEKEPHWPAAAEKFLWVLLSWVALEAPPELRHIQTVCQLLASPERLKEAIALIRASTNTLLARLADQLTFFVDREFGSTLTTTNRFLDFLCTPALVESTSSSTFDPACLRKEPTTVYLILPVQFLRTSGTGLLRLWITSLLRACVQGGLDESRKVWFLLDEAGALGHLECLEDAITQMRGFGVRLLFVYQSLGQIEKCFPKGGATTFLACMSYRVYFGLNDYQTAESVSQQLGEATVANVTESGGSSWSTSTDHHGHQSKSRTGNDGWSVAHVGRKLLQPAEILRLDERIAVVFAVGVRPFLTRLVRAYEPEFVKSLPKPMKGGE